MIGYDFLKPVAGVLTERLPVRALLVTCDLAQAVCMIAMAALVASGAHPLPVLLLAAVATAFSTPYFPVLTAVSPRLVAENQLAATNTVVGTVENLGLVVGPALGGLLLLVGDAAVPIGLNGLTFLVSAAVVASIHYRGRPSDSDPADLDGDAPGSPAGSFLHQMREGGRATVTDPGVLVLATFTAAVTFVYGFELVYLVFVARDRLGMGSEGVGYLTAAVGLGGLVGALLTNWLVDSPRVREIFFLTLVGNGVPLSLLGVIGSPVLAIAVLAVEGAAAIALDVLVVTSLQRIVRQHVLGRVSSIVDALAVAAILIGNLAAVALLHLVGLRTAVLVAGGLLPVIGVALLPMLGNLQRRVNASRMVLTPAADELAASGLFEGADRPMLERLAAVAQRETLPAGTVLLREGDEAREVLVLVSGSVGVEAQGRHLSDLTGPGYVGEIGIVRRIPRTATVTATSSTVLLRIRGEEFLDAISGSPPASVLHEMSIRLDRSGAASGPARRTR